MALSLAGVAVIAVLMLLENRVSRRNDRALRAAGAIEPEGDVYRVMQWAYPGTFAAMALEGLLRGGAGTPLLAAGTAVFAAGKAIKYWAIASLGPRWSFRVRVIPGLPLVTTGPYRFLRHPNYVGIAGELVGSALFFAAPVAGVLGTLFFAELLRRRIRVERRALGLDRSSR